MKTHAEHTFNISKNAPLFEKLLRQNLSKNSVAVRCQQIPTPIILIDVPSGLSVLTASVQEKIDFNSAVTKHQFWTPTGESMSGVTQRKVRTDVFKNSMNMKFAQ